MVLRFFNTLSRKKEVFKPLQKGRATIYSCGPTVYHYAHIGNARAVVFADVLRRTLVASGYHVKHVMNITDVGHMTEDIGDGEDKMEREAARAGKTAQEVAHFYTKAFFEDLRNLGVNIRAMKFPRATDYIKEQIAYIRRIEAKGFTYQTSDGIYFDASRIKDYGRLARLDKKGLREGARIAVNTEKRNPTDFALWKFSPAGTKRQQEWNSPWGVGFPGWHIECSAMGKKFLGDEFDIHTGGIDLVPVHHVNEIAQSEAVTGHAPARFWLHSDFVNMGDNKMSKSLGNIITLSGLMETGVSPLAYRYLLLATHYRKPLAFTPSASQGAVNAFTKLHNEFLALPTKGGKVSGAYKKKFFEVLEDDLNTPRALAVLWAVVKDKKLSPADKRATLLSFDEVLGLGLKGLKKGIVPKNVMLLAEKREEARAAKNWKRADAIRDELAALGYEVMDTSEGFELSRVH